MIRTRFAPSPTGLLHIGNLRTAIYAYVMAAHNKGQFILRIEDTDQKRLKQEGYDDIKKNLDLFGLHWDELYIQSQRKQEGIYQKAAEKLVSQGHAFYCQCQAKNAKTEGFSSQLRDPCRDKNLTSGAIKLKVPNGETISYHDFVLKKDISWQTDTIYDATLLKSDGFPTYHLAAMVDDVDMRISHILRGHDWMPSTPVHLLVFKYLGSSQPEIGHLTDIQSPNGGKLSKRKDSVFVETFINNGYLPDALFNFVILLGWAPKDNRDTFTLKEFVEVFDPAGFQSSNPLFSYNKLDWFNGFYIRQKSDTELTQLVKPFMKNNDENNKLTRIVPIVKDRLTKLSDINNYAGFFFTKPTIDPSLWSDPKSSLLHLEFAKTQLNSDFSKENIDSLAAKVKEKGWKIGDFFMSLRIAVCGSRFTPPLTDSMLILGQPETLSRLSLAITLLSKIN
jgi:glutamyl-tRNA synthetase